MIVNNMLVALLLGSLAFESVEAPKRLTQKDLDGALYIGRDEGGEVEVIRVNDQLEVRLQDKDHDGRPDAFELWEGKTRKIRRWYSARSGPPNGGTFYYPDGTERTISWGPYREEEAEKYRLQMEQELENKKP